MYRIIKSDGTELGITDKVLYVKIKGNTGNYVPCSVDEAMGVAFNGTAYGLVDRVGMEGIESVVVSKFDVGNSIFLMQQDILDNAEMLLNMQYESDMESIGGAV